MISANSIVVLRESSFNDAYAIQLISIVMVGVAILTDTVVLGVRMGLVILEVHRNLRDQQDQRQLQAVATLPSLAVLESPLCMLGF